MWQQPEHDTSMQSYVNRKSSPFETLSSVDRVSEPSAQSDGVSIERMGFPCAQGCSDDVCELLAADLAHTICRIHVPVYGCECERDCLRMRARVRARMCTCITTALDGQRTCEKLA